MKKTKMNRLLLLAASIICFFTTGSYAQENRLRLSGFSELRLGSRFGAPANEQSHELYEEAGHDPEAIEKGFRLQYPGLALNMLSELSEKVYFQGEISFAIHHNAPAIEFNRLYLDYRINEKFNLITGQFLTPVGYLNMNQRIYGYLNYSLKPRDMVNEEYGFIPVTTLGVQAYGRFDFNVWGLNYRAAYGAGRGLTPHQRPFVASIGQEENSSPAFTGLLEAVIPTANFELKAGLSAHYNSKLASVFIKEIGETIEAGHHEHEHEEDHDPTQGEVEEENTELRLQESIFAPYLMFDHNKVQLFVEYHYSMQSDREGNLPQQTYHYNAVTAQALYKTALAGKPFYPYVRYDISRLPVDGGGPYYGLVQEEEFIQRTYVPNTTELMIGFAWDILPYNRLKLEYSRYFDGPFLTNGVNASTSFAF